MKFSIIIPSYNQPEFIEQTLKNTVAIKNLSGINGCEVEILLFDSNSKKEVQAIIEKYKHKLDVVEIAKDKGQYDAINKGILKCTGDYWTWLNTDDLLNVEGFFELVKLLKQKPDIDYIYGGINHIDAEGNLLKYYKPYKVSFKRMATHTPGIFQQGSFFRTEFTKKVGFLNTYNCCFDYDYVLRVLQANANMYVCDFLVADFRHHNLSKTGSIIPVFIKEQLTISEKYGRKWFHFLSWFSHLRLIKHKLFPRK